MFIGAAVARGTGVATTSTGSSMSSLDRTLIKACRLWMIRFRAPLAHAALIDSDLLSDCMQRAAKYSGRSKNKMEGKPSRMTILSTEDDEEKMTPDNDVWTDDDVEDEEDFCGPPSSSKGKQRLDGNGEPEQTSQEMNGKNKVGDAKQSQNENKGSQRSSTTTAARTPDDFENHPRVPRNYRGPQDFRRSFLLGFPTMNPPPSVIPGEDPNTATTKTSTDRDAVPMSGSDAESFISAAALERSTALEHITEETRIYEWPIPGRSSSCGIYKVKGDTVLSTVVERDEQARRLDFYFGPGTRRLAED
jgi:hypothetical protein